MAVNLITSQLFRAIKRHGGIPGALYTHQVHRPVPDVDVFDNDISSIATVKSWDREFLGSIPTVLHEILKKYMTESNLHARVVPHVQ